MDGEMNPSKPFAERLAAGKEFEETASKFLTSLGWPIGLHFSAKGQWEMGESAAHVEIKNDNKFPETGNLFIETRERRDSSGLSQWRNAGIYDASDPWFFLIGNPSVLWLLSVRWLRLMHQTEKYRKITLETAEGFVIPVTVANHICIIKWEAWGVIHQPTQPPKT